MSNFQEISAVLEALTNKEQAIILQRFFKTGPGQYGEGDIFLGIKVPVQRQIAIQYADAPLSVLARLLKSKIHEYRLVALLILVRKYETAPNQAKKQEIFDFYLANLAAINNWDLVDLTAPKIVGDFLFNYWLLQKRSVKNFLMKLAISNNLWVRRIAIISTFYFIRAGRQQETFIIAKKLLADKHDLIHKAVGWMLREVGARISRRDLLSFLDSHYSQVPRTALRYAIEHLPEAKRQAYLKKELS